MANEKNLIKNEDLTPSQRRKNASKAGKASVKARREKKTIQTLLNDLLNNPCKDNPRFEELAKKLGIDSGKSVKQLFTMVMTMNTLEKGNLDDLKTLIVLLGETIDTEQKTTPAIEELAKSLFGEE